MNILERGSLARTSRRHQHRKIVVHFVNLAIFLYVSVGK
jgi:hypothetical protein